MVECQLPKLNVAGSNPVTRFLFRRGKFYKKLNESPFPEGRGNRLCAHLKEQNAIQLPHTRFDEFDPEEWDAAPTPGSPFACQTVSSSSRNQTPLPTIAAGRRLGTNSQSFGPVGMDTTDGAEPDQC